MEILSDKLVITRKTHRCFACERKFEARTKMQRQVNVYDDICSIYTCETCHSLISEFSSYFIDESENVFNGGCVLEYSNNPEQLLKDLREGKEISR